MNTLKRTAAFLFTIIFVFGAFGTVKAQETASHNVSVPVEDFSFINVSEDLSVTINAYEVQQNGAGGITGDYENVTGPNNNGNIQVRFSPTTVEYGTNSASQQQVTVQTSGTTPFQLRTSSNGSIFNVTTASGGSAGNYAGQVNIGTSLTNLVTGVSQAGASLELNYVFDFNMFEAPTSESQNITYTITAN